MSVEFLMLVPVVFLTVVGVVVLAVLAATARPSARLAAEVAAARRHANLTSLVATAAFLALGFLALGGLAADADVDGSRLTATAPLICAAVALVVLLVGELTWPRPTGVRRTALLNARTPLVLTRSRWACGLAAGSAALAALLGATGLAADETGRSLTRVFAGSDLGTRTHGAFPGWFYGVPQLAVLTVLLVLVALVIRTATHRPAVVSADLPTDNLLRRGSVVRALRVALSGVLVTLAGDLFIAGYGLNHVYDGGRAALGAIAMLAAGVLGIGALVALVIPAPRLRRELPAPPAVAA